MGVLFGYQGRYGAALSSQEDALKTLRDIQEHSLWILEILDAYGNALAEVGRSDDAQKALDEALALARELKDQAHVASTLEAQGDNQFYRGDIKAALALYAQARQEALRTARCPLDPGRRSESRTRERQARKISHRHHRPSPTL